jgi:NADPH:quinone reductase-like Zn-dependent oxidoreductase
MRAVRIHSYGNSDQLKIEEIPDSKIKDVNEVLVKIHAAGVNPVDWKIRGNQVISKTLCLCRFL